MEKLNLGQSKHLNLNYSCNDAVWSKHDPDLVVTAATNGAVILWNLARDNKTRLKHVFSEHKRTVNKVNFHPNESSLLLSGSQDCSIRLFDLRSLEVASSFGSNESIRDLQFNPFMHYQFASVAENGRVSLWDIRKCDKPEKSWHAHAEYSFTLDWHSQVRYSVFYVNALHYAFLDVQQVGSIYDSTTHEWIFQFLLYLDEDQWLINFYDHQSVTHSLNLFEAIYTSIPESSKSDRKKLS